MNESSKPKKNRWQMVETFNRKCPPGTKVFVLRDSGGTELSKVRAAAEILCNQAVVWLNGITGAYALDRVSQTIKQANAKQAKFDELRRAVP